MTYITKEQFEDIDDAREYGTRKEYHEQLEIHTGIVAKPYTAYQYFDSAGNFVGDSDNYTLSDLLENANIEVRSDTNGL